MENNELIGLGLLAAGAALAALAYLWLVVRAFRGEPAPPETEGAVRRGGSVLWGLGLLVFPPLALVYVPTHWRRSRPPLAVFLIGCVVIAAGLVVGALQPSRDPRVTQEADGKHITLTNSVVSDYSFLQRHPDAVVLQMANPDVTDETLKSLEGLTELKELDLNDTQVGDGGLASLAKLQKLKVLRLNRTAVTDAGFREHLAGLPALEEVNLRGTKVATKTLRDWKKAGDALGLDRKFTSGK